MPKGAPINERIFRKTSVSTMLGNEVRKGLGKGKLTGKLPIKQLL